MQVMQGSHFWQFSSIASLATETTDGDRDSSSFFGPNMASESISECLKFLWGSMPPDTLKCTQWPYQSKIAGTSPAYKVKGAFSTPVRARKQANGPPGIDQGFSTGSCKRRRVLSARAVHPPTSPCPTLSASAEPIFKTVCTN